MQQLTFLPPVVEVPRYSSPGAAMKGGMSTYPPTLIAPVLSNVRGHTIVSYESWDSAIHFKLDNDAGLYIRATQKTPICDLRYEPNYGSCETSTNYLGAEVIINWSKVGPRTWKRIGMIDQIRSKSIKHIASHDFGLSVYFACGTGVFFSSEVDAVSKRLILFWDESN